MSVCALHVHRLYIIMLKIYNSIFILMYNYLYIVYDATRSINDEHHRYDIYIYNRCTYAVSLVVTIVMRYSVITVFTVVQVTLWIVQ